MADFKNFAAGTKFTFKGYEKLEEGQPEIFAKGDIVVIAESPSSQESFDNDGVKVQSEDGTKVDTFFDTEIEAIAATPPKRTRASAPAKDTKAGTAAPKATLAKGKAAKAPKTPKVKPVKEAKEPVATVRTEQLTALLAETPDVLEAIAGLQDTIEQSFFSLGGLCSMVLHEGLYKKDYPDAGGFKQWCEEVMNMGQRKVRSLITIYVKTTAAGFDENKLSDIGWTKARVLQNFMEDKNFDYDKAIEYAGKHTRDDLEKHLEKKYPKVTKSGTAEGNGGTDTTPAETVLKQTFGKFTLFGEQASMAESAFKKAAEIAESDDPNKAFEQIVTDWASLTDGVTTTLEMEVARLNKKFGVVLGLVEAEEETDTTEAETAPETAPETETVAEAPAVEAPKGRGRKKA